MYIYHFTNSSRIHRIKVFNFVYAENELFINYTGGGRILYDLEFLVFIPQCQHELRSLPFMLYFIHINISMKTTGTDNPYQSSA